MSYRRRSSSLLVCAVVCAVAALPTAAQDAVLVADIETTGQGWQEDFECAILCPEPETLHGSHPLELTPVGDKLFFSAFDFDGGRELWVTDGAHGVTRRVADLCPGPCGSNPRLIGGLAGELFFWAAEQDVVEGPDVRGSFFVTDGTDAGTRRLDGVCGGPCSLPRTGPGVPFDGSLFFVGPPADGSGGGQVLWRTDGSAAGTAPLRAAPVALQPPAPIPVSFSDRVATTGDALYVSSTPPFASGQPSTLLRLAAGEERASRLLATCRRDDPAPQRLHPSASGLAFVAGCLDLPGLRVAHTVLFLTDGTAAGTRVLFDPALAARQPVPLAWLDGELWFAVNDTDAQSAELWRTDGTPEGLLPLSQDLPPIPGGFVVDGRVVFLTSPVAPLTPPGQSPGLWTFESGVVGPRELVPGGVREVAALGHLLLFSAVDGAGREPWVTDGTPTGTRRLADVYPGAPGSLPRGFTAGDRVYFTADDGVHGRELWAFPRTRVNPEVCVTGGDTLCLADGRFRVRVRFRNQRAGGAEGVARAVPGTARAGFFWFFREDNLELMVKVLDGTALNGHHWLFWGGITDLEYDLEVTDLDSGVSRTYHHPPGDLCGGSDTRAFPATVADGAAGAITARATASPVAPLPAPLTPPPCGGSATELCVGGVWQLFGVTVTYRNQYDGGAEGPGMATPMTGDAGWFWFFNEENPEVMVKVLDGTAVNGHFWVFIGGLSTVEYEVTLTATPVYGGGETRTYRKPAGSTCGIADVTAFDSF